MVSADPWVTIEVLRVRVQNRNGVIFRGRKVSDDGNLLDAYEEVTIRIHGSGIAVKVAEGQWWRVRGIASSRTFINSGGFEMTEEHIEVRRGDSVLVQPSGAHLEQYLRRFHGIGPGTSKLLWKTFGDRLVEVLDDGDYQALADVVSPEKAATLVEGWREEGLSKTLQWLQANNVGLRIGRRVIDHFGSEAVQKIQENPYRLLSFSAGWEEVDALATRELGVDLNDGRRLAAAVEEVVYARFTRGDTYVPRQLLVAGLKRLLKVDRRSDEIIHTAIENSEITGRLLFDLSGNAYSIGASILEDRVVDAIRLRSNIISPACDVDGIVRAFEDRVGFDLEPEQRAAVHLAADHHFCVITGGAGCGKTTVLKAVCEVLEAQCYKVIQIALAGKAVKRMMEATDRKAFTIASFLKKLSDSADTGEIDASVPTAVLIDEASMVDLLSFAAIARALRDEVKIIMVGDPHQLPPVGPGLVLHALPGTPGIAHVELKAPRRFDSAMAAFANFIKEGVLQAPDDNSNIKWIEAQDEGIAQLAASLLLESPDDAIVLTSTKELAHTINQIVQESMTKGQREIMLWNDEFECMEATGLREGDAVICTANHWDRGIQNGSMGTVLSIAADGEEGSLGEVEWDDGVIRPLTEDLLDDLELGWALTVHKSQGSQWRRVLVCLPTTSRMVDRSAIYTAVTRVRSQVLILGQRSHLVRTVAEKKAADRRHVGLPKRLARMYSNYPNAAKTPICDTNASVHVSNT